MSDGERPRSGLSQASSVLTISSVTLGAKPIRSVRRVHTFGKRGNSIKRDPNSPVVIRGWLYKQDSSGLKLWKRRWFVLSNYCLFYYRDSREEMVLGSIPLPSYEIRILPKEAKNRRFTFKAEHPGMRTYYFSADTQEDMNGWVRAMSQSAAAESDSSQAPSETKSPSGEPHRPPPLQRPPSPALPPSVPPPYTPAWDPQHPPTVPSPFLSAHASRSYSLPPTPVELSKAPGAPPDPSTPPQTRRRAQAAPLAVSCEELPLLTHPWHSRALVRPHTPVGRVDIAPGSKTLGEPQAGGGTRGRSTLGRPQTPSERYDILPYEDPYARPLGRYPRSPHPTRVRPGTPAEELQGDMGTLGLSLGRPHRGRVMWGAWGGLGGQGLKCCAVEDWSGGLDPFQERLEKALEVTRHQLEDFKGHDLATEKIWYQQRQLQDELVQVRAQLNDLALVSVCVCWEGRLGMFHPRDGCQLYPSTLCLQEQKAAQQELWMIEDILAGLKAHGPPCPMPDTRRCPGARALPRGLQGHCAVGDRSWVGEGAMLHSGVGGRLGTKGDADTGWSCLQGSPQPPPRSWSIGSGHLPAPSPSQGWKVPEIPKSYC
uniref:Pleckstrin homology domain containing A4 n=1 Tax=Crocodylus porosus TaxID=8502 RepID=A0A7M4FIH4_CROPO